jgi:hypothetical protein
MTTLKLASQMDEDTRIKCYLAGWVAVDENCGELGRDSNPVHLRRSNGRRRAGRPAKYWLHGTGELNAPVVKAYTDEEAVELANQCLEGLEAARKAQS